MNTAQLNTLQWHLPKGVKGRIGQGTVNNLAYSPDSTILAVASSIGTWFYDTHSGNEIALLTKDGEGVNSIGFSPDGKTLAAACGNKLIRLWNVETRKLMHTFRVLGMMLSVSYSVQMGEHWQVGVIMICIFGI